jgi:hypothetical protein
LVFLEQDFSMGYAGFKFIFSDRARAPDAMRSCSGWRGIRLMAMVVCAQSSESDSTRDSGLPEVFV